MPSIDTTTQLADAVGVFDGRVADRCSPGSAAAKGAGGTRTDGVRKKPRPRIEELRKLIPALGSVLLRGIGAAQAYRQGEC